MSITRAQGKQVLGYLLDHPNSDVPQAIQALGIREFSAPEIVAAVRAVLEEHPDVVQELLQEVI